MKTFHLPEKGRKPEKGSGRGGIGCRVEGEKKEKVQTKGSQEWKGEVLEGGKTPTNEIKKAPERICRMEFREGGAKKEEGRLPRERPKIGSAEKLNHQYGKEPIE